jgi:hypothetical protein
MARSFDMTRKIIFSLVLLLAAGVALAWAATRFDHRAHLEEYIEGTSCDTCHLPDARTIVPDKAVCLDCHDEEMAKETKLNGTKTHGPVWALNHRSEAKGNAIDCAACHDQSYCLECHKSGFADEQGDFGNNMINVHRSDFHITHPISARTNPQLCSSCHEPSFCRDCHDDFRFRTGRASGPSHRRLFDLIPDDDPARFNTIHQGVDATQCDTCHANSTPPDLQTWSVGHGREARKSLATCQTCHPEGDICINCHSARAGAGQFNPHGRGWDDRKGRLERASNGKTCRKCHDQF